MAQKTGLRRLIMLAPQALAVAPQFIDHLSPIDLFAAPAQMADQPRNSRRSPRHGINGWAAVGMGEQFEVAMEKPPPMMATESSSFSRALAMEKATPSRGIATLLTANMKER